MPRTVQRVTEMEIDEVSLVDRPACPPSAIVFSKRADQEESMPDYTDEDGNAIDLNEYEEGDVLEDEEGNQFVVSFEDVYDDDEDDELDGEYEELMDGELATIGKSFGSIESIRYELSKAVTEDDRDRVVSKALNDLTARAEYAETQMGRAALIAKSEQNLRLEREYISKAAEYNVPIDSEDLGPVIMRMAESMSYEDCAVIHKALSAAGEMLFTEAGYDGIGAADDPIEQIQEYLAARVSKGGSREGAMTDFFDSNPEAYEALRAAR